MGRQVQFYMLAEDQKAFLRYVQEREPVVFTTMIDRNGPAVRPVTDVVSVRNPMFCLWNRALLPVLKRQRIGEAERTSYMIGTLHLPVLEFSPTIVTEWEDRPALVQGRLYGQFDPYLGKPPEFEKWYEKLLRWIRKNYRRNPAGFGGYVGPAAYQLFLDGAYLLPSFRPPRTDVWLAEIGKQHQAISCRMPLAATSDRPPISGWTCSRVLGQVPAQYFTWTRSPLIGTCTRIGRPTRIGMARRRPLSNEKRDVCCLSISPFVRVGG